MRAYGPDYPYPVPFESHIKIDGDTIVDGENALKVYENSLWDDELNLCAIIKIDGEKVYTLNNYASNQWYLAYDFSLNAGEGCWVSRFDAFSDHWHRPGQNYMKCVGIEPDDEYEGWPVMHIVSYATNECKEEDYNGECYWLIGIGNT